MKNFIRHTFLLIFVLMLVLPAFAQNVRYVKNNSIHALAVPENPAYSFEWSMTWGSANNPVTIFSKTNVTENIRWSHDDTFYKITVYPICDSTGCMGEPIYMTVYTVDYLSLHAFDDVFCASANEVFTGNVSVNDFDETGAGMIYNPTLIDSANHGTVSMTVWGEFTYTPNPGYVGSDEFVYEVSNDANPSMSTEATVYITVQNKVVNDKFADLYIEKIGPNKALYGKEINYQIVVKNNGPDVAPNVVVKDTMPFGLFNPQYSLGNTPNYLTWKDSLLLGNLKAGDSVLINLRADISSFSPEGLWNQAIVWSDVCDPQNADNDSIWYTKVSVLFADNDSIVHVPACDTFRIQNTIAGNAAIQSIRWRPSTGLSDSTIASPLFTPDENTIGKSNPYVLIVTDANGNQVIDTITLVVPELPYAKIESDTMYMDKGVVLTVHAGESHGDGITYNWWAQQNPLHIIGSRTQDSIYVDSLGVYHLIVRDQLKCEASDSVVVLYKSHPPVALNDTVEIVAGTDSTVNVLANDYDKNGFDIRIVDIVTPPNHGVYSWGDSTVTFTPDATYWSWDSLEYKVANNGHPEMDTTAWLMINCLRPPLNADVVIEKSTDQFNFWGDSIEYVITVHSNGPDTATFVTVIDTLNPRLINPVFSVDDGATWNNWLRSYSYTDSLIPNTMVYRLLIKALVPKETDELRNLTNYAYVTTNILENDSTSNVDSVTTKIKDPIIANAGDDLKVGSCTGSIELDGTESSGENLTYSWTPNQFLDNNTSATPVFTAGSTTTYVLTITDDDGLTDTDSVTVRVLPPPLAKAGPDQFLMEGGTVVLDGRATTPATGLSYLWTTTDGHLIANTETGKTAGADMLGTYKLTVTDSVGCTSQDEVSVYRYYYPPVAIPDYYSIRANNTLSGENVLANDYDPNHIFSLSATPVVNYKTKEGGTVNLNADGSFTYVPKTNFTGVDGFNYNVCNSAVPPRCSNGYVQITVNLPSQGTADLSIKKDAIRGEALIGDVAGLVFSITVKNNGPSVATDVFVTDTMPQYVSNVQYVLDNINGIYKSWKGFLNVGNIAVGDSVILYYKGKVESGAPDTLYNAATVASEILDQCFDWGNVDCRNVDTATIRVVSDLIANAKLVERSPLDDNWGDNSIGFCDNASFLDASGSKSTNGIDAYAWYPSNFVASDSSIITTITPLDNFKNDTIINFTLMVTSGNVTRFTTVPVTISPQLKANCGPDKKINEGESLIVDATGSQGTYTNIIWHQGSSLFNGSFKDGNKLRPIVTETGVYILELYDKHGCYDSDTLVVRFNQLYALNDILVVQKNDTVQANFSSNDYDPDGDSIFFSQIIRTPSHGTLLETNSDGSFTYVPDFGFIGDDYFIYESRDDNDPNLFKTATVNIKVIDVDKVNSQPVANSDFFFVNLGDTLRGGNLLANDYDFDGGDITINTTPARSPKQGSVTIYADGSIQYIPNPNAAERDSFTYSICDNGIPSKCDTAQVYIYINKIANEDHYPVAVDDAYFVVEKTITGNILLNDYDPDGDLISLDMSGFSIPSNALVFNMHEDGSFEYEPKPGFTGTDQFVYRINEVGRSENYFAAATVYITCLPESLFNTDVEVVKEGPETIISGDTIQYTLTAKINGPTLANDIVIQDTLLTSLINPQYSVDSAKTWNDWENSFEVEQLMLYDSYSILVRAVIPEIFSGNIVNLAYVDHDMGETKPSNNKDSWTTNVLQKVLANAGPDTTLGACVTDYVMGGTGSLGMANLTYRWSPADNLDDSTNANPIFRTTPETSTQFVLVASCTYNGVTYVDSDTVDITVAQKVIPYAGEDQEPEVTDPAFLDGRMSNGDGPLKYHWWYYDKSGNQVSIANTDTVTVHESGGYYLTVTDIHGCDSTDRMNVIYPIDPFVAIDDTITTPQQEPVEIVVLRNDIIDPDDEYNLDYLIVIEQPQNGTVTENPADSSITYTPNPYFVGYDTFTYIISTKYSNSDEAQVFVAVLERAPQVPGGFSPNGDGINDALIIENIDKYKENVFTVFNRWGNIVYKKVNYSNDEPWDGVANKGVRIGNGPVPSGPYLFILNLGDDKRIKNNPVKGYIYVAAD